MNIFRLLGFISLFIFSSISQAQTGAFPKNYKNIKEMTAWAEKNDYVGATTFLPKPQSSADIVTSFGAIIDKSCSASPYNTPLYRDTLKANFEYYIAAVFMRAEMCLDLFKISDLDRVLPILRRTRFTCTSDATKNCVECTFNNIKLKNSNIKTFNTDPNLDNFHNFMVAKNSKYKPFNSLFSATSSSYDRDYEIQIDLNFANEFLLNNKNQTAALLFHNVLHHAHQDNRANHFDLPSKPSLNDRVYFLEAICFPHSDLGQKFYAPKNGDWKNPAVCEDALAKIDASLAQVKPIKNQTEIGVLGSATPSHIFSVKESDLVCSKIQSNIHDRNILWSWFQNVSFALKTLLLATSLEGRETFLNLIPKNFDKIDTAFVKSLKREFSMLDLYFSRFKEAQSFNDAFESGDQLRDRLKESIKKIDSYCQSSEDDLQTRQTSCTLFIYTSSELEKDLSGLHDILAPMQDIAKLEATLLGKKLVTSNKQKNALLALKQFRQQASQNLQNACQKQPLTPWLKSFCGLKGAPFFDAIDRTIRVIESSDLTKMIFFKELD